MVTRSLSEQRQGRDRPQEATGRPEERRTTEERTSGP